MISNRPSIFQKNTCANGPHVSREYSKRTFSQRRQLSFGSHIGTASILLIFLVLCLVSFAVLSLTSALSDKRLSEKAAGRCVSYYQARSEAAEYLTTHEADLLAQCKADPLGHATVNFPLSEIQTLRVTYELSASGSEISMRSCYIVTDTSSLEYQDTLPLFTGQDMDSLK